MKERVILYLHTDSDAQHIVAGGSIAHMIGVISGFIQQGKRVICATSSVSHFISPLAITDLVTLSMPYRLKFLGHKLNALLSSLFFAFQIIPLFQKYDVEFIYQRYSLLNCTGILLAWWYKKKLILEFNSSKVWTEKYWSPEKKISMRFLVQLCERLNIFYAHNIIAISDPIKNILIQTGAPERSIIVNPNGVDSQRFDMSILQKERRRIRTQLGLSGKYVFGFIGTFSYWHGVDDIIDMVPRVYVLCPQAHFLLIGNGPLFATIEKKIATNHLTQRAVTLTGVVPQYDAQNYLAACDAFLAPTQPNPDGTPFFGSPTKLFEYMSLAKPIIASSLDQIKEVLSPAYTLEDIALEEEKKEKISFKKKPAAGILTPPGNVTGLVIAASWLYKKKYSFQKKIGLYARNRVITHYTWDHHVQKIINTSEAVNTNE